MSEPMMDGLETRLKRLERSNRWLKWILAVTFTGQLVGLVFIVQLNRGGGVPVIGKTIEAGRLIIRDSAGKARVVVGQDENADIPEPQYGIFNYSKDGESESGLTSWNLHIYSGDGSADFSPVSVSIHRYKQKVVELNKKQSEYNKQILRLSEKASGPAATKEDKAALDKFIKQHDDLVASFYLNMAGPYLEMMKKPRDQDHSGAGEAKLGVSPYPSVELRSSQDKTSVSLNALKE